MPASNEVIVSTSAYLSMLAILHISIVRIAVIILVKEAIYCLFLELWDKTTRGSISLLAILYTKKDLAVTLFGGL